MLPPMAFPEPFYRWRPHPWHGLSAGENPPTRVNAFIEITPFDVVKYEVDKSDRDPLDICVISERPINRIEILTRARVVGGLQMIDGGEADDKIIAVLDNDPAWSEVEDIAGLPPMLVGRIEHYFSSYKTLPGEENTVEIPWTYGADHATKVVMAAMDDYAEAFGES
jgi:inorganic pyrophosphatase